MLLSSAAIFACRSPSPRDGVSPVSGALLTVSVSNQHPFYLVERWDEIEPASPVAMFKIRWHLPERYIDADGKMEVIPFFPLPYRLEKRWDHVLFAGSRLVFMDEVVFLKRWLETFAQLGACVHPDGRPRRPSKAEADRLIVDPLARNRGYAVELVDAGQQ